MRSIEQPLIHQITDHDHGTGDGERQSKQDTSSERPSPQVSQQQTESGDQDLLDGEEITAEARGERTDSDTGQHIPHHGWQLQAASKKPTYESRQECHSNIDQNRKFMLHLFPPSLAELDPG